MSSLDGVSASRPIPENPVDEGVSVVGTELMVGWMEGNVEGSSVGELEATSVGSLDDMTVGDPDGIGVGTLEGEEVGTSVGKREGALVGTVVGDALGDSVGADEGNWVGGAVTIPTTLDPKASRQKGWSKDSSKQLLITSSVGSSSSPVFSMINSTPFSVAWVPSQVVSRTMAKYTLHDSPPQIPDSTAFSKHCKAVLFISAHDKGGALPVYCNT